MLTLALDTSGDLCSVALFDGDQERATYTFRHERRLSERLPGIIEFVLEDGGSALREVEALAVGLGPGSFTGVRIGVTMAKAFAWAMEKPLVGVSSLQAVALPFFGLPRLVIATVTPTRRGEVVAAFYHGSDEDALAAPFDGPRVVAEIEVVSAASARFPGDSILVCGEAAAAVAAATPPGPTNVLARYAYSSAANIARLAAPRLAQGEHDDAAALVPLYVTPTPVG
ncbi:MAG: tRNA (adenosine(37)-N6)-threonylcarbamoyltransferase complex dimerization subunit type 1 TsaB [Cytophagales bacterium]|nr:tRNA (adenosine(37)-N6)-threonylcarbamoyltransferase complex dimerization subunit type 1 TsaB [Armatimonadota bacterium]